MMLARFGDVLYWLGCGIAVALLSFASYGITQGALRTDREFLVLLAASAAVFWLIGRACRYVLSGR
jgi:hypothetical protein